MSIYSPFLKKISYFFVFTFYGFYSFVLASEVVKEEGKKSVPNQCFETYNYSEEAKSLYHQALGCRYENNLKKFETYLIKAAENGHLEAACTLGTYYELTQGDKEKAFVWYTRAADQGYEEAQGKLKILEIEIKASNSQNINEEVVQGSQSKKLIKRSSSEKFLKKIFVTSLSKSNPETVKKHNSNEGKSLGKTTFNKNNFKISSDRKRKNSTGKLKEKPCHRLQRPSKRSMLGNSNPETISKKEKSETSHVKFDPDTKFYESE